MSIRCWLLAWFLSSAASLAWAQPPLLYLTESYPPYNYMDNNILRGIAVDLLVEATRGTSLAVRRDEIRLWPWPRAYRAAQERPHVVLFSTARTPAREKLFKWAGPITGVREVFVARKARHLKIVGPQDLAVYRIGAVPEDIGHQILRKIGISDSQIQRSANSDALARQLAAGRIDLWIYDEASVRWFIRNAGLNPDDFEVVYEEGKMELWYALSLDVEDDMVKQLQEGIDKVKNTPGKAGWSLYQDILLNYF